MKSPIRLHPSVKGILKKNNLKKFKKLDFRRGGVYGSERKSILHLASKYCTNKTIVEFIISHLNVNHETKTKRSLSTALHYACIAGKFKIVSFLIKSGADVNALRRGKQSPIMVAVRCNRIGIAKILISKKADLFTKDKRE